MQSSINPPASQTKFPLSQIDALIRNPLSYMPPSGLPRYARSSALRDSLFRYHKKNSQQDAIDYLKGQFKSKSWDDVDRYIPALLTYINSFKSLDCFFVKSRLNFKFAAKAYHKGFPIVLHGQISRIDLTKTGYAIWIFGKDFDDWKNEFRYPLLQLIYSRLQRLPVRDISVGIYDITAGAHDQQVFNQSQLEQAEEALLDSLAQYFL